MFTGTSRGIYQWIGTESKKISEQPGYIDWDPVNAEPVINKDVPKIFKYEEFSYLLPNPDQSREVFYGATKDYLYIVADGHLYVFKTEPYRRSFKRESIRSISKNYVGGYSGIYKNGVLLEHPSYVNGYIREIGDTAFIMYDGVVVIKPDTTIDLIQEIAETKKTQHNAVGQFRDVLLVPDVGYFFSTDNNLFQINFSLEIVDKINDSEAKNEIILITRLGEAVYYSFENHVCIYNTTTKFTDTLVTLSKPVVSGIHKGRLFYLLTEDSLYMYNRSLGLKNLHEYYSAHTLLALNSKEIVVSSNTGLFIYNVQIGQNTPLLSDIEFNKKALYKRNNSLLAGAVTGLYKIDLSSKERVIEEARKAVLLEESSKDSPGILLYFISGVLLILTGYYISTFKNRKKIEFIEQGVELKLTETEVLKYIKANLKTVSVKSLCDHYNISTRVLYNIFDEYSSPGIAIRNLRMEKMNEILKNGGSIDDVVSQTGFSEGYAKKLMIKRRRVKG